MNLNNLPFLLFLNLSMTIILELVLSVFLRVKKKDLIYVVLVNILTNPLLNTLSVFSFLKFHYQSFVITILVLEIVVVLIEGFIYKKVVEFKKINPFQLSFILNLFSFIIGLIISFSLQVLM